MNDYQRYMTENKFGWQIDRAVFVKVPFSAYGKQWKAGEHFNWINQHCRTEDWPRMLETVSSLFRSGKIHHDSTKEVQQKVGDRLGELDTEQLASLVRMVNAVVKDRTTTSKEFESKRVKISKIPDKQRGLIRSWLNRNHWATDEYYKIRDDLLEEANKVPVTQE